MMKRASKMSGRAETLAEKHRRLVRTNGNANDVEWLEQPVPDAEASDAVRFVTTYGVNDQPL